MTQTTGAQSLLWHCIVALHVHRTLLNLPLTGDGDWVLGCQRCWGCRGCPWSRRSDDIQPPAPSVDKQALVVQCISSCCYQSPPPPKGTFLKQSRGRHPALAASHTQASTHREGSNALHIVTDGFAQGHT